MLQIKKSIRMKIIYIMIIVTNPNKNNRPLSNSLLKNNRNQINKKIISNIRIIQDLKIMGEMTYIQNCMIKILNCKKLCLKNYSPKIKIKKNDPLK